MGPILWHMVILIGCVLLILHLGGEATKIARETYEMVHPSRIKNPMEKPAAVPPTSRHE